MMIIVTVVSVTNGGPTSTRGGSKFTLIKSKLHDKGLTIAEKLKSLSGNSHAKKAKGWGKSAHTKLKGVSDKHPKIKEVSDKVLSKLSSLKDSASQRSKGTKARGLVNNAGTKAKDVVDSVKKQLREVKMMIRSAQAASKVSSKLKGLTNTFTKTRGVGGRTAVVKSALHSGSDKIGALKDSSAIKLNALKEKSTARLASLKESGAVKKMQSKIPASSLETLKKLPGADKLKGLASHSSSDTASKFKDKFATLKSAAAGFKDKHFS